MLQANGELGCDANLTESSAEGKGQGKEGHVVYVVFQAVADWICKQTQLVDHQTREFMRWDYLQNQGAGVAPDLRGTTPM